MATASAGRSARVRRELPRRRGTPGRAPLRCDRLAAAGVHQARNRQRQEAARSAGPRNPEQHP
jgi:hypothetical protein